MWRIEIMVREVIANLIVEGWRALSVVALITSVVAVISAVELSQVHEAVRQDGELAAAGRYAFIAYPEGETAPMNPLRCLALEHNSAVLAVGGFTETGGVSIQKAPGELLRLRAMVGQTPKILSPSGHPPTGEIYVAEPAAQRIGLGSGMTVSLDGLGSADVAVIDMSARIPDPGPWVWTKSGPILLLDECWVEVEPSTAANASGWIRAWLTPNQGTVVVTPFLGYDRFRLDPVAAFHTRPTKFAWVVGGVAIGLYVSLIVWLRRPELALYRTVGSSRVQTALIFIVLYGVLGAAGLIAGPLLGLYLHGLNAPLNAYRYVVASRQAALIGLTATLVYVPATLSIASGRVSEHIRQHL